MREGLGLRMRDDFRVSYGQHLNGSMRPLAGVLQSADGVTVAGWDPPDGCERWGGNGDTFTSMVRSLVLPDNLQR